MTRVRWMWIVVAWLVATPATAQVLDGEWVRRSEQRIADARQTDLRVVVLDANDRAVVDAPVRVEQVRHDFPVGFTLRDTTWPSAYNADAPLWRVFNAIAIDGVTGWSAYDEADRDALAKVIQEARQRGMFVRWGGGIAADMARNPDWLSDVAADDQRLAIEAHARQIVQRYGWQVDQLDLYTHALDHDLIERRFGLPALRGLYEQARADSPNLKLGVRVHDRLVGDRLQELVRAITDWRHSFVPVDVVAIEQRVRGTLAQAPVERALSWLSELDVQVVLVGLEVGGVSDAAAAMNLETLLRLLFADENVGGIWFGDMSAEEVGTPYAELFDADGELTHGGQLVDRLFSELWWTDETLHTDELGNARTRVFAGTHRITAELGEGRSVEMTVHVPMDADERMVVVQEGF
ncbi:endo-1,4-beta-xylanase [Phycisphaerales bacterium AB-hyl4]|uniref:endo-1,4-beta-xylanase n=1 Tax=Natronomicrosphaera hydrolytica TaxID=3242702 RepID=A0ABV4U402_9BACT